MNISDNSSSLSSMSDNLLDVYHKNSFNRFGDDLSHFILSHLSFEERFLFESVSKQWQTIIFSDIKELVIDKKLFNGRQILDIKVFESLLKKCPNIRLICFEIEIHPKEAFEAIVKYCNKLEEIHYCIPGYEVSKEFFQFMSQIGTKIKGLSFTRLKPNVCPYELYLKPTYLWFGKIKDQDIQSMLKLCPNLEKIVRFHYNDRSPLNLKYIFDGNQVLLKNLKSFVFKYNTLDFEFLHLFIESNKNSLKRMSIKVENRLSLIDIKLIFDEFLKLSQLSDFNLIYGYPMDDQLCESIENLMRTLSNLKKINLSLAFEKHFTKIYNSLNYLRDLESLSLTNSNNYFSIDVSKPPESCRRLTHLSFGANFSITDEFFDSIDKQLPDLKFIHISNADINEKTFKSLFKCSKMRTIILKSTSNLPQIDERHLYLILRKCPKLKCFFLSNRSLRLSFQRKQIEELKEGKTPKEGWIFSDEKYANLFPILKARRPQQINYNNYQLSIK